MHLTHKTVLVKSVRNGVSQKTNKPYQTISLLTPEGSEFSINCGAFDLSKVPLLVPLSLDALVLIKQFNMNTSISFDPSYPPVFKPVS